GANDTLKVSFMIQNDGHRDGAEVPQVYVRHQNPKADQAKMTLCGFARVDIPAGKATSVNIEVPVQRFRHWNTEKKQYVIDPGEYELVVGPASDDVRARTHVEVK